MAVCAAARSKSPLGNFCCRLIAAGKIPKVATVALMRKNACHPQCHGP
jgi:hypothetical protein